MPKDGNEYVLASCLSSTLIEYIKLSAQFDQVIIGIITTKAPGQVILNQGNFTLQSCIGSLEDRSLRILAYRHFSKYPIEDNVLIGDDCITENCTILIDNVTHDALYLKAVYNENGILFSLALHEDLKKDMLVMKNQESLERSVNNLFGTPSNTLFISHFISESIKSKLGNFEKLLAVVGANSCSKRFKKGFESISKEMQDAIISHFQFAIERAGVTFFFADGALIKDVTPANFSFHVFELRIFDPVAYRIYFYEAQTKVYLALMEPKPQPKVQNNNINNAASIITELVILDS